MTYAKPQVEVVKFENAGFMTASADYSTVDSALQYACTGFSGASNNFTCDDFGGYNSSNPPKQNTQYTIAGTTYVFDYKGNHWKQH